MQVLLMAGGGGTRLWPLSTEEKPKQFLALFDKRSLLRTTFERISPLTDPSKVWLSGNIRHQDLLSQELPELAADHFILEPAKRDNAAAICISQLLMQKHGVSSEEIVIMLPCDHRIENEDEFRSIVTSGEAFLAQHPDHLLTIGIHPTHPETGYGYIAYEYSTIAQAKGKSVLQVKQFVEKPNKETAEAYLAQGNYVWNSGIYMWRIGAMLHWCETLLPEIFSLLHNNLDQWQKVYPEVAATSLDYGISEKLKTLATIPAQNLGWSDVGDFRALGEAKIGAISTLDVNNSYLRNETTIPIKVIGLDNIVVVQSNDGLLVCHRDRAQDIKKVS